jgi:predicted lipoprotein with Yx(FWY)xxD motif
MKDAIRIDRKTAAAVALVIAAGVLATGSAFASGSASTTGARVVMTAKNATLHATILVNRRGLSLYSLSAERNGRFICTDAGCMSLWKPLVVRKGVTPTGAAHLGTVRRPDGRRQVTYRGGPLYTFTGDHRRGDVKGNGFKDVGIWRVATVANAPAPAPPPAPYPAPYPN